VQQDSLCELFNLTALCLVANVSAEEDQEDLS
jgi:hypothetical protein